ncbi:MAG: hypothetical protein ABI354_00600 [Candidatus Saccharimonadales bacterium]
MNDKVKIVFTVPESDADRLRQAVGDLGAGKIGNYSHCSFSAKGIGRFSPETGANPAVGHIGKAEEVIEERIEITCSANNFKTVVELIRLNHPYEEPVIDVYPLVAI